MTTTMMTTFCWAEMMMRMKMQRQGGRGVDESSGSSTLHQLADSVGRLIE